MNTVNDMSWAEGGNWIVSDRSSYVKFYHTTTTSSIRPKTVNIDGSNWNDADLSKCITQVSKIRCGVHLELADAFEKSTETTAGWLSALISKEAK